MKEKYSLALWWGAARWFAHIWVIQYIEENDIGSFVNDPKKFS